MEKERCTKTLKYNFSGDEKKELAAQMSEASAKEEDLEVEKREVSADIKARIETTTRTRRDLAKKYRDGYEWRPIECEIDRDFEHGVVRVIRTDTGEEVEERKMTNAERQQEICV